MSAMIAVGCSFLMVVGGWRRWREKAEKKGKTMTTTEPREHADMRNHSNYVLSSVATLIEEIKSSVPELLYLESSDVKMVWGESVCPFSSFTPSHTPYVIKPQRRLFLFPSPPLSVFRVLVDHSHETTCSFSCDHRCNYRRRLHIRRLLTAL